MWVVGLPGWADRELVSALVSVVVVQEGGGSGLSQFGTKPSLLSGSPGCKEEACESEHSDLTNNKRALLTMPQS